MHVIGVVAAKGGVGKTTTAAAVAYELARRGRRVLLCDFDPQAGLTLAVGVDPATDPLGASPATLDLPGVGDGMLHLRAGGRKLAGARRRDVAELLDGARDGVDVLVCDCAPAISAITLAVLEKATLALVPLSPSSPDLQGLADVVALLSEMPHAPPLRTVMVRVHPRRILTREVRALLLELHPGALLSTHIPSDARVPEAPSHGLPLPCYAPRCRAAGAYRTLTTEIERLLDQTGRCA